MRSLRALATFAASAATVALASAASSVQEPGTTPPAAAVEAEVPAQEAAPAAKVEVAPAEVEKAAEEPKVEAAGGEAVVEKRVLLIQRRMAAQAAAKAEKADDDPDKLDPEAMQYVHQVRPIARAELHRLRLVAKPSDDQMKAIARESRRAVNAAASRIAKQMRGGMVNSESFPDPVATIGAELVKIAAAHLTPEQQRLYEAEHARQVARQKNAAIRLMLSALDDDLTLSKEQREAIEAAMREKWSESWVRALAVAQYGRQYVPAPPDPVVVPHLTERQKPLWEQLKRNRQQIFGFFWHSQMDNTQLEPELADEVAQPAVVEGGILVAPGVVVEEAAQAEPSAETTQPDSSNAPEEP